MRPPCKSHACLVGTGVNCPEHQCMHSQRLDFLWYVCLGEWQACAYVNEVCETVAIVNTDPREWVTVVRFMFGIAEDTGPGFSVSKEKREDWNGVEGGECDRWGPAEVHHAEALVTLKRVQSLRI